MKKISFLFVFLMGLAGMSICSAGPVKLACVGNSITEGAFIPNNFQNSYPGILMQMLGDGYDVRNFGVSGTTTLSKGNYPYISTRKYKEALEFLPDIVTIKLGTNDTKSFNWVHGAEYERDLISIIESFRSLSSKPRIILCLPVPALDYSSKSINDSTLQASIIPTIQKVAKQYGLEMVDLHEAMKPYASFFPDRIHPTAEGSALMASVIYKALTGSEYEGKVDVTKPFPGSRDAWKGFDSYSFFYHGRKVQIAVPKENTSHASEKPWIYTSSDFSDLDLELLGRGFHVVSYLSQDMDEMDGEDGETVSEVCKAAGNISDLLEIFKRYYGFSEKCALESNSVDFIQKNASSSFAIYYSGKEGSVGNVTEPLISLNRCGKSNNTLFETLDGTENTEAVSDFISRYRPGYEKYQNIHYRGTLKNAFTKFISDRKGCVAFLGGSITEMDGWKNMIEEDLKQRFPSCEFTFIEAGISSLGSIPHSFRMDEDVLQKGTPDLLFVEAAVNDDTNSRGMYLSQTRAMEGIVRHALSSNPNMDIVMLHFIYDPFIPLHASKISPDVIMNHERIANWYSISSIDLSDEIASRMENKEFTWEQFGGTHPAHFGHKFYAATINRLFDENMKTLFSDGRLSILQKPHELPSEMLDSLSYERGKFVDIHTAQKLKGFSFVESWNKPKEGISTRKQYVNVPMLIASEAGSSLEFSFEGTAVGVYGTFGPNSCVIEYSVDGAPYRTLDTYTKWSGNLYLPWVYIIEDELSSSSHKLSLRIAKGEKQELMIYKFVINE